MWKTIRVIRKNMIIKMSPKETIYLPSLSNGILWDNPQAVAGFYKIVTKGDIIDFKVDVIIEEQTLKLICGDGILDDSIITVLIWEGDLI